MAAAVTQRTRELGVRLALGASRGTVLRMVLGQGLKLVLPGVALGLLLSASVSRLMGSLLYGVSPLDPTTYALVAATLTVVAMGASGVPATRAARVDPNTSMRSE
jgi:putative ABC transport system permease protein